MPIVEAEGNVAARRDGDVVDFLFEKLLVEFLKAERLCGKLPERVLMDAVVAAGVRGGAGVKVVFLAGGLRAGLPAVVVAALGALDFRRKAGGSLRIGACFPALFGDLCTVLRCPAILMASVRSVFPDEGSVLQEEVQRVFLRHLDVIHLVEKDIFVKFLKTEDFAAGLFQCLLADGASDRAAFADLLFLFASTIPIFLKVSVLRAPIVHVAVAAIRALDLAGKAADVQALVGKGSELPASGHLVLDVLEGLHVDDGLVGVFDEVLRQLATVLLALLGNRVCDVLLLQEHVPGVGNVGPDVRHGWIFDFCDAPHVVHG